MLVGDPSGEHILLRHGPCSWRSLGSAGLPLLAPTAGIWAHHLGPIHVLSALGRRGLPIKSPLMMTIIHLSYLEFGGGAGAWGASEK